MTSEFYRNRNRISNSNPELENTTNTVNVNSIDGYVILGHGNNGTEKIIVPEGSIVVAKAHPGDDKMGLETKLLEEEQAILNTKHLQTILNPLKNAKNLYKLFGSVSIFTGGQTCPNFEYGLIAIHERPNSMMRISMSGIIKIPVSDLNSIERAYMFNRNMTIRMYKNNPEKFKIGSLFSLCDNNILQLDTIDHVKEKILTDKLELYKYILNHFDKVREQIKEENDDDLLIMIGIRKSKEVHGRPMINGHSKLELIQGELKKVFKAKFDSLSESERNFYINKDKIGLDRYIDEYKDDLPAIISSLETDIQSLKNRTIEEYIDDYLLNYGDDNKLLGAINELKDKLFIYQSTIFKNSLKPSITYNFVCRVNVNSKNWYNNNYRERRNGIVNTQRAYNSYGRNVYNKRTINERIKNARTNNTRKRNNIGRISLTPSVRNQISEAELQRKGQIRNAKNLL